MVKILTVCTGNVCRSPFAERLLQTRLDALAPDVFQVRSAGTQALAGRSMDARSAELLLQAGGDPAGFVARQLTDGMLKEADFVLGLSTEHRDRVVSLSPRMLKRAFTLREFARVLERLRADAAAVPGGHDAAGVEARWTALPKLAALSRHTVKAGPEQDDVVDPFRRDEEVYQQTVAQLLPAVQAIVSFERHA